MFRTSFATWTMSTFACTLALVGTTQFAGPSRVSIRDGAGPTLASNKPADTIIDRAKATSLNSFKTEAMLDSNKTEAMLDSFKTEAMLDSFKTEAMLDSFKTEAMLDSFKTEAMLDSFKTEAMLSADFAF